MPRASSIFVILVALGDALRSLGAGASHIHAHHHGPRHEHVQIEARTCGTIVQPSDTWLIFQDNQNESIRTGPYAGEPGVFYTAQNAGATSQIDLIASFKHMPCPPLGYGPYALEFAIDATASEYLTGQTRIDMYHILDNGTTPLSATADPPTWQVLDPLMGSLAGTFSMSAGPDGTALVNINQFVCQDEMNYRFSITNDDSAAGSVMYAQTNSSGLRIRYSC